jgi:hypothetical protein
MSPNRFQQPWERTRQLATDWMTIATPTACRMFDYNELFEVNLRQQKEKKRMAVSNLVA